MPGIFVAFAHRRFYFRCHRLIMISLRPVAEKIQIVQIQSEQSCDLLLWFRASCMDPLWLKSHAVPIHEPVIVFSGAEVIFTDPRIDLLRFILWSKLIKSCRSAAINRTDHRVFPVCVRPDPVALLPENSLEHLNICTRGDCIIDCPSHQIVSGRFAVFLREIDLPRRSASRSFNHGQFVLPA